MYKRLTHACCHRIIKPLFPFSTKPQQGALPRGHDARCPRVLNAATPSIERTIQASLGTRRGGRAFYIRSETHRNRRTVVRGQRSPVAVGGAPGGKTSEPKCRRWPLRPRGTWRRTGESSSRSGREENRSKNNRQHAALLAHPLGGASLRRQPPSLPPFQPLASAIASVAGQGQWCQRPSGNRRRC